jgi:hypothetical protein
MEQKWILASGPNLGVHYNSVSFESHQNNAAVIMRLPTIPTVFNDCVHSIPKNFTGSVPEYLNIICDNVCNDSKPAKKATQSLLDNMKTPFNLRIKLGAGIDN